MRSRLPFAIDEALSSKLDAVLAYWRALRRGEASIPFADDIDIAAIRALCPDVFILSVFEKPERFRLDLAYAPYAPRIESELQGRFIDEFDLSSPLDYLRAQADAAVVGLAPTYYRHTPSGAEAAYGRLLLPTWGEGQVKLLLGAIEPL